MSCPKVGRILQPLIVCLKDYHILILVHLFYLMGSYYELEVNWVVADPFRFFFSSILTLPCCYSVRFFKVYVFLSWWHIVAVFFPIFIVYGSVKLPEIITLCVPWLGWAVEMRRLIIKLRLYSHFKDLYFALTFWPPNLIPSNK